MPRTRLRDAWRVLRGELVAVERQTTLWHSAVYLNGTLIANSGNPNVTVRYLPPVSSNR